MLVDDLRLTDDASAGAWIAKRLRGDFGAVTLQVPSGFEAYARICHPAADHDEHPVTWPQVASATGRTAHALMQWHALVGSPDWLNFTGSLWPGAVPERGNLAPEVLKQLCALLGAHTSDAAHCFFGLWIGWGWVHGGGIRMTFRCAEGSDGSTVEPAERIPPAFSANELSRPRLELPGREYLLFSGPLSAATQIGDSHGVLGFDPKSPNLMWPSDRAWFLVSEIDFDSTLVGGTRDLIESILGNPGLDAWPVGPKDSFAHDADRINLIEPQHETTGGDE